MLFEMYIQGNAVFFVFFKSSFDFP